MAKKKIDPLNRKQYGAVSAALTVSNIPAAVSFYQKAFGFSKRGIMNGPDGNPIHAELTLRNVSETTTRCCAICGTEFEPVGRQRFDKPACRQAAWRRRHPTPLPPIPARAPRHSTVYQCPSCESRYLGEQYCGDCGTFCLICGQSTRRNPTSKRTVDYLTYQALCEPEGRGDL